MKDQSPWLKYKGRDDGSYREDGTGDRNMKIRRSIGALGIAGLAATGIGVAAAAASAATTPECGRIQDQISVLSGLVTRGQTELADLREESVDTPREKLQLVIEEAAVTSEISGLKKEISTLTVQEGQACAPSPAPSDSGGSPAPSASASSPRASPPDQPPVAPSRAVCHVRGENT